MTSNNKSDDLSSLADLSESVSLTPKGALTRSQENIIIWVAMSLIAMYSTGLVMLLHEFRYHPFLLNLVGDELHGPSLLYGIELSGVCFENLVVEIGILIFSFIVVKVLIGYLLRVFQLSEILLKKSRSSVLKYSFFLTNYFCLTSVKTFVQI